MTQPVIIPSSIPVTAMITATVERYLRETTDGQRALRRTIKDLSLTWPTLQSLFDHAIKEAGDRDC